MTEEFNVLWIDDEHEGQLMFKRKAKKNGIKLFSFGDTETGINAFNNNREKYDLIILDMRVRKDSATNAIEDSKFGFEAYGKLQTLDPAIKIIFLTGDRSLYENYEVQKIYNNDIYFKFSESEEIFNKIKEGAASRSIRKLRHAFSHTDIFELIDNDYLDSDEKTRVLYFLECAISNGTVPESQDKIISIRKTVEALFQKLCDLKIIPIDIIGLNARSKFLAGAEQSGFKIVENLINPLIAKNFRRLLEFGQDGAHKGQVDSYIQNSGNDFLYKGLLFTMLDTLHWAKKFIEIHQDYEGSGEGKFWNKIESQIEPSVRDCRGIIKRIYEGNGILECVDTGCEYNIVKRDMDRKGLRINDKIQCEIYPHNYNGNKVMHTRNHRRVN